jgi:hypothetical protein
MHFQHAPAIWADHPELVAGGWSVKPTTAMLSASSPRFEFAAVQ